MTRQLIFQCFVSLCDKKLRWLIRIGSENLEPPIITWSGSLYNTPEVFLSTLTSDHIGQFISIGSPPLVAGLGLSVQQPLPYLVGSIICQRTPELLPGQKKCCSLIVSLLTTR